ncbi:ComEC family competence protein, partial [Bacteroides faecichinchillae]
MDNYYLHQYPYIRLIIPWITGVFCGDMFFDNTSVLSGSILLFCFFVGLSFTFYFLRRHSLRWCFGISVSALCFMGGWIGITGQLQQSVYDFKDQETVYRVRLTDAPELKERSYLCRVFLEEYHDSANICPVERKAILYLEQDSSVVRLQDGDELLVSSQISPPVNGKNFGEFDYSRYLMYKGIAGTGYVASGKWTKLSSVSVSSLRLMANSYREKLLALYRKLGFEGDELAVLSALTVGDKTELSESIRESYSVSGASHVLALSGLHIGLLYVLFSYILKLLDVKGGNAGKYLRTLLLLLLLWSFAFFTGLSPSVIRSASMFSALAVAEVFSRKAISLNTLAAVAWFMLLCKPVWLFDVGFQLSFLAVASILLIQKPIYQLLPVKGWLGKYIWRLMAVSIAAQLGTAPLVMFYFSRFSTHFLLTNLVVIPLVTIILYMAVLMLCLTPFFWLQ